MWVLDPKESCALRNLFLNCGFGEFLDCKEIKPFNPKGNQPWIFIGRTDAEGETPILWPPDVKNWLIGRDPDPGKYWRQEKGMTENEMVGWHSWLNAFNFSSLFCSDSVIFTILFSSSLICSSTSVILLFVPSTVLFSLVFIFNFVYLFFTSSRHLLKLSCIFSINASFLFIFFSIMFLRFWIIFIIISLIFFFSDRLPISSSFVWSGGDLEYWIICYIFHSLFTLFNLLCYEPPFTKFPGETFYILKPSYFYNNKLFVLSRLKEKKKKVYTNKTACILLQSSWWKWKRRVKKLP